MIRNNNGGIMNASYKIHIFYIAIILLVFIVSNYKAFMVKFFSIDTNSKDYIQLQTDVSLINPKNGDIVGYLKKHVILKRPSITDLDDRDLGDHDRFKILLDLENIDPKERKDIKRSNLTTNDFKWLYNSLTVKQNENK